MSSEATFPRSSICERSQLLRHSLLPLLWVPVEPIVQLESESQMVVLSGIWKGNEWKHVPCSLVPAPTHSLLGADAGVKPEGLSLRATYFCTCALCLVHSDDHVGHDEE